MRFQRINGEKGSSDRLAVEDYLPTIRIKMDRYSQNTCGMPMNSAFLANHQVRHYPQHHPQDECRQVATHVSRFLQLQRHRNTSIDDHWPLLEISAISEANRGQIGIRLSCEQKGMDESGPVLLVARAG